VRYILGGEDEVEGLTEPECARREQEPGVSYTTFHPGTGKVWAYNEYRTLRMEYEAFNRLKRDFATEIERNIQEGGTSFEWKDIAGISGWNDSSPEANVRIGGSQTFEEWAAAQGFSDEPVGAVYNAAIVLQQFNASTQNEDDRLRILNDWLGDHGLGPIELWRVVSPRAGGQRIINIGWIESLPGVLLP
jgi:hypothetical protein